MREECAAWWEWGVWGPGAAVAAGMARTADAAVAKTTTARAECFTCLMAEMLWASADAKVNAG